MWATHIQGGPEETQTDLQRIQTHTRVVNLWHMNGEHTQAHTHIMMTFTFTDRGGTSVHTCRYNKQVNKQKLSPCFPLQFPLALWRNPRLDKCVEPQPVFLFPRLTSNHKLWFYIFDVFFLTAPATYWFPLIFPLLLKPVWFVKIFSVLCYCSQRLFVGKRKWKWRETTRQHLFEYLWFYTL